VRLLARRPAIEPIVALLREAGCGGAIRALLAIALRTILVVPPFLPAVLVARFLGVLERLPRVAMIAARPPVPAAAFGVARA
jgi:hypothetical protein